MQGCMKSFFREDRDIHRQRGVSINKFFRIVLTSLKIMIIYIVRETFP